MFDWLVKLLALLGLLSVLGGCTALSPGGEVARGLTQEKLYRWDDNGNFSVEGKGPQTERFLMLQGELQLRIDAETGEEVPDFEHSTITYYLRADPAADDAANTMNAALIASTAQMESMGRSFDNLIATLLPLLARQRLPARGNETDAIDPGG